MYAMQEMLVTSEINTRTNKCKQCKIWSSISKTNACSFC